MELRSSPGCSDWLLHAAENPRPIRVAGTGNVALPERWRLLAPYRSRLIGLAVSRGARLDAEDVAQEALLRAAVSQVLDETRPWPYLAAIVTNLARDRYRRSTRDLTLHQHRGLVARDSSVEDDVAHRDDVVSALKALVDMVPMETVVMAWRRYADGATWHEVGREFGRSGSAVESQVRRAMLRVRRAHAHRRHR